MLGSGVTCFALCSFAAFVFSVVFAVLRSVMQWCFPFVRHVCVRRVLAFLRHRSRFGVLYANSNSWTNGESRPCYVTTDFVIFTLSCNPEGD